MLKGADGKPDAITTYDLRRIAADALAVGGQHERAAAVYDLITRERPGDREALEAKERYLAQSGRVAELVDFLAERAQRSTDEAERGKLLERAAEIAERDLRNPARAVELWLERSELSAGRVDALRALDKLYESLGDDHGLKFSLEGQLKLAQSNAQRIDLLRRLGRHAAHRLAEDALAEESWAEILRAVPDDREVRDELVALYRRRGDFAALDRALDAQGWRPAGDAERVALWRNAAENVETKLPGTGRSGAAWRRVLDLAPDDREALAAVVRHERQVADTKGADGGRGLIAALEAQLRTLGTTVSIADRVELTREIATRWDKLGDVAAAAAAYERILWWAPEDAGSIAQLLKLGAKSGGGAALYDHAATVRAEGSPEHLALLRAQLSLTSEKDPLARFYAWRRFTRLAGVDAESLAELTRAATSAKAFGELEAVLIETAARAEPTARRQHFEALASLYEKELRDPVRALLARTSARHEPVHSLEELEPALRL